MSCNLLIPLTCLKRASHSTVSVSCIFLTTSKLSGSMKITPYTLDRLAVLLLVLVLLPSILQCELWLQTPNVHIDWQWS
jgi:hypothetical protein